MKAAAKAVRPVAALRGGIKTVLIPEDNAKDLADIPESVKNKLEIIPVRWIDKVLEVALERQPEPVKEDAPVEAVQAKPESTNESAVIKH